MRKAPTPCGVPVVTTSPGSNVKPRQVGYQIRNLVDQFFGVGILQRLAVNQATHAQVVRVGDLVARHQIRPQRAEGVQRLAHDPLVAALNLQVTRADIVAVHVPGNVVEGVRLAHVARPFADHNGQFRLEVDLARHVRVPANGVAGANDRTGILGEHGGDLGHAPARLAHMVHIVQPDSDDLRRVGNRRHELHIVQRSAEFPGVGYRRRGLRRLHSGVAHFEKRAHVIGQLAAARLSHVDDVAVDDNAQLGTGARRLVRYQFHAIS